MTADTYDEIYNVIVRAIESSECTINAATSATDKIVKESDVERSEIIKAINKAADDLPWAIWASGDPIAEVIRKMAQHILFLNSNLEGAKAYLP